LFFNVPTRFVKGAADSLQCIRQIQCVREQMLCRGGKSRTRNTTNTRSLQYVVYLKNYRFTLRKHRQSITKYICCPERKAMPDSYTRVMVLHPKQAICLESEA